MSANGDGALAVVMGDVDIVRALGVAGISSAFFGYADDAARFSRHVRVSLPWIDQWERPDDIVDRAARPRRLAARAPGPLSQTDATLLLASRHRERLGQALRLILADHEIVEQLVDKELFQALAERHGLPVPRAQRLRPDAGAPCPALDIPYPVIVKPLTRSPAWAEFAGAGKTFRRVYDAEELRALWPRLAGVGTEFLAQRAHRGARVAHRELPRLRRRLGGGRGRVHGPQDPHLPGRLRDQHGRRDRLASRRCRARSRRRRPPGPARRRQARLQARRGRPAAPARDQSAGSTSGTTRAPSPA